MDDGKEFGGRLLRMFDTGHQFEDLTIRWLQAGGFDLRTRRRDGRQFGFSVAGGRLRRHIDGAIVGGPDVGIVWPALFEHKALKQSSWTDLVKRGLRQAKPIYFAQVQLYMAYMQIEVALFKPHKVRGRELEEVREKDLDGRIVVHHRTVDTLGKMLRSGTITQEMHDAAKDFQAAFIVANLDPLRALPILRVPGTGRARI